MDRCHGRRNGKLQRSWNLVSGSLYTRHACFRQQMDFQDQTKCRWIQSSRQNSYCERSSTSCNDYGVGYQADGRAKCISPWWLNRNSLYGSTSWNLGFTAAFQIHLYSSTAEEKTSFFFSCMSMICWLLETAQKHLPLSHCSIDEWLCPNADSSASSADIQFAVNYVYQKMHAPTTLDFLLELIVTVTGLVVLKQDDQPEATSLIWVWTLSPGLLRSSRLCQRAPLKQNTELSLKQLLKSHGSAQLWRNCEYPF